MREAVLDHLEPSDHHHQGRGRGRLSSRRRAAAEGEEDRRPAVARARPHARYSGRAGQQKGRPPADRLRRRDRESDRKKRAASWKRRTATWWWRIWSRRKASASNRTRTKWCWCCAPAEPIPVYRAPKRAIAAPHLRRNHEAAAGPARANESRTTSRLSQLLSGPGRRGNLTASDKTHWTMKIKAEIIPSLAPRRRHARKDPRTISAIAALPALCEQRNKIVFGSGNEQARLVFVGEGPGADEDAQGMPFVGRAGQLLTQMIEDTAAKEGIPIKRRDVYICNVVKCRPPENRTPQPDEMEICGQFLFRQLMAIQPESDLRAGVDGCEGAARDQGRRHAIARQVAQVARHSGDGDLSSVVSAAPLQPEREARSVGGSEEGSAFCLRLRRGARSSRSKARKAAANPRSCACWPSGCATQDSTVLETAEPGGTPIGMQIRRVLLDAKNQELCPTAELLLMFAAARRTSISGFCPRWRAGQIVLSRPLHRFDAGLPGRRRAAWARKWSMKWTASPAGAWCRT